jgi:hypothetical protein
VVQRVWTIWGQGIERCPACGLVSIPPELSLFRCLARVVLFISLHILIKCSSSWTAVGDVLPRLTSYVFSSILFENLMVAQRQNKLRLFLQRSVSDVLKIARHWSLRSQFNTVQSFTGPCTVSRISPDVHRSLRC